VTRLIPKKGAPFWLCPAFFLLAAAPGFWVPVLANVLHAKGWGSYVTLTFMVLPLSAILSPLIFSARADQVIAAEKLLGIIVATGAILAGVAFMLLEQGKEPILFILFLGLKSLVTAPAWPLLTTITLSSTDHPERDFGKIRVWGSLGWMVAGWLVSLLAMDLSASVGWLSVGSSILAAVCCFLLPHCPPKGGPPKNALDVLGLRAFRLFKQRDTAMFFGTAFLFSIPLAAYFMHTPQQLRFLGCEQIAAVMTVGQLTEVVAMLMMGWLLRTWSIKSIFVLALVCGTLRYLLYAVGASDDSIASVLLGVALHGICWTYFFEAGKVFLARRIERGIRTQSQALLALLTSGIGGLAGTAFVGWAHGYLVDETTGAGWSDYWWLLTAMCGFCVIGFMIGYRGNQPAQKNG
jgi:MFS family permease